ncbi:MAG: hypothetical protein LBU28_01625, partial [Spirochaetaceae bacterium]|nr:hypothetical protein [Spirochaetaceae bacterium]
MGKIRFVLNLEASSPVDNQFIRADFADRKSMPKKLKEILATPQFCGEKLFEFKAISDLSKELKDEITCILEYPYVDRHYRDTFYFYHSAKFEEFYRNCIR